MRIVAGCDGGGTKCDVRIVVCDDSGAIVRTAKATSGPANVKSNPELALQNVRTATREAMGNALLSAESTIESFVLALASAGSFDLQQKWQTILCESLPVEHVRVVPDAAVLFAAADENEALPNEVLAMIVGTGSIVLTRDRAGRVRRAGGLGPAIGDEGSGYWIGREAIRRCAARDGSSSVSTKLAERVRSRFPQRDLADLAREGDSGCLQHLEVAAISYDVFDVAPTDELAQGIVAEAADQIVNLLCRSRLGFSGSGSRETSDSELSRTNLRSVPRLRTFLTGRGITEAGCDIETAETAPLCWICAGGVAVNQSSWLQTIRQKCADHALFLEEPILIREPVVGAAKLAFEAATNPTRGLAKKPDLGWDAMFGSTEVCCAPSPLPRSGGGRTR